MAVSVEMLLVRVKLVGELQVVWAFLVLTQKTVFITSGEVHISDQLLLQRLCAVESMSGGQQVLILGYSRKKELISSKI